MPLFDTHAHLDDEQLIGQLDEVISLAREAGLVGVTAIGTTVESSRACLEIAERFVDVFAAVGIHPNHSAESTLDEWSEIRELCQHPRAVALGETGLDRYWDYCPFRVQQVWFRRHIELSSETGLPLVVHMRECEADIVELIGEYAASGPINGIMHSFSGSWETARQCLDFGMHISFAGMLTFKKSDALREVAARVPLERLLVETDSPYLTPHPHRGRRPNSPAMVQHTAACLAEVKGISAEELGRISTENAIRIFGVAKQIDLD